MVSDGRDGLYIGLLGDGPCVQRLGVPPAIRSSNVECCFSTSRCTLCLDAGLLRLRGRDAWWQCLSCLEGRWRERERDVPDVCTVMRSLVCHPHSPVACGKYCALQLGRGSECGNQVWRYISWGPGDGPLAANGSWNWSASRRVCSSSHASWIAPHLSPRKRRDVPSSV